MQSFDLMKIDKDKLSLYVSFEREGETKFEGYKEGTTQLRQREGEFARAFCARRSALIYSSGFKATNEPPKRKCWKS